MMFSFDFYCGPNTAIFCCIQTSISFSRSTIDGKFHYRWRIPTVRISLEEDVGLLIQEASQLKHIGFRNHYDHAMKIKAFKIIFKKRMPWSFDINNYSRKHKLLKL